MIVQMTQMTQATKTKIKQTETDKIGSNTYQGILSLYMLKTYIHYI